MRGKRFALLLLGPILLFAPLGGCDHHTRPPDIPENDNFEDFTAPDITSLAQLRQMAAAPPGDEIGAAIFGTKFVITRFSEPEARKLRFLDGRYYFYHDEWAWFRLLNAQSVPGMSALSEHRRLRTPEEGRRWAFADPDELPDGLAVADDRLYSAEFYERALMNDREFGTGTLIYIPARADVHPEIWGFELEYSDTGDIEQVMVFFDSVAARIPEPIRPHLKWITRSPHQAEIGRRLVATKPEFADRVMSYDAISVPGETAIYNPGIVAGRLQVFRDLAKLSTASPDNILLLGALPEYLPQARGVLTAIPQTQLSHLNLLAKSRGIVNAYRGGLLDDPEILNLARSSAPVVLSTEDGKLRFRRITEAQYTQWLGLQKAPPPPPRQVAWENAPYLVDLSHVEASELDALAPIIGGKSVGMVHLLKALGHPGDAPLQPGVAFDVPDRPLAVTVRAYREHLTQLLPEISALLADPNFVAHRKLRILALEGIEKFEARFASKADRTAARSYLKPSAPGAIAAVVRKGGVQHMIRKTPLPEAVDAELERIRQHFANYAPDQGLRFRSSSTVEDVEGSSGAGLYESFTGYVKGRKAKPGVTKRASLADALRKTWASYFSVEAFEERHEAGMDHLSGNMGVLVHARFDNEFEDANGVFTFTLHPKGAELLVDAQPGAVSVTNPPTDRVVIPESARVTPDGEGFRIDRASLSSEAAPGVAVLSDLELRELFGLARRFTEAQIARNNAALSPTQQRRSLVMDFEFRRVKSGWPALRQGVNPARFVVKQMRPLEPNPGISAQLRSGPIPRDVLAQTRRIERRECRGATVDIEALMVFTDANVSPDLGYSTQPLFASLTIDAGGRKTAFTHLDQRVANTTSTGLYVEFNPGMSYTQLGLAGDKLLLTPSAGKASTAVVKCQTKVEFAAPTELLREFLETTPTDSK